MPFPRPRVSYHDSGGSLAPLVVPAPAASRCFIDVPAAAPGERGVLLPLEMGGRFPLAASLAIREGSAGFFCERKRSKR